MNPLRSQRYRIELAVMTMTHVWGGDSLVYGIDYEVSGDKLLVHGYGGIQRRVNAEELTRILVEGSIVDALKALGTGRGGAARSIASRVPRTLIEKMRPEIRKHLVIGGRPLIPGSEVKGLIRTALLYYMLAEGMIGIDKIRGTIEMLGYDRDMMKYAATPIEAALRIERPIDMKGLPYDILSLLSISDPLKHSVTETIDYVAVAYTRKKGLAARVFVEALDKGSIITYSASLIETPIKAVGPGNEMIGRIRRKHGLIAEIMWRALEEYSRALIGYEKKQLETTCKTNNLDCGFIDILDKWMSETGRNNTYYLKIGFATGHAAKTVYLALPDELRGSLIKYMTMHTGRLWDDATIKLIGSMYEGGVATPFAWIKLRFIGEET